ncbi:hypothetical protein ACFLX2_00550 [Candidatus Dependentiae bacterium]
MKKTTLLLSAVIVAGITSGLRASELQRQTLTIKEKADLFLYYSTRFHSTEASETAPLIICPAVRELHTFRVICSGSPSTAATMLFRYEGMQSALRESLCRRCSSVYEKIHSGQTTTRLRPAPAPPASLVDDDEEEENEEGSEEGSDWDDSDDDDSNDVAEDKKSLSERTRHLRLGSGTAFFRFIPRTGPQPVEGSDYDEDHRADDGDEDSSSGSGADRRRRRPLTRRFVASRRPSSGLIGTVIDFICNRKRS